MNSATIDAAIARGAILPGQEIHMFVPKGAGAATAPAPGDAFPPDAFTRISCVVTVNGKMHQLNDSGMPIGVALDPEAYAAAHAGPFFFVEARRVYPVETIDTVVVEKKKRRRVAAGSALISDMERLVRGNFLAEGSRVYVFYNLGRKAPTVDVLSDPARSREGVVTATGKIRFDSKELSPSLFALHAGNEMRVADGKVAKETASGWGNVYCLRGDKLETLKVLRDREIPEEHGESESEPDDKTDKTHRPRVARRKKAARSETNSGASGAEGVADLSDIEGVEPRPPADAEPL